MINVLPHQKQNRNSGFTETPLVKIVDRSEAPGGSVVASSGPIVCEFLRRKCKNMFDFPRRNVRPLEKWKRTKFFIWNQRVKIFSRPEASGGPVVADAYRWYTISLCEFVESSSRRRRRRRRRRSHFEGDDDDEENASKKWTSSWEYGKSSQSIRTY